MKLTKKILAALLLLLACSIVLTAFELKRIYAQNEKGELYFLYSPILEQPFSHLVVNGGNISNIIFEPAAKTSVRVFKRWNGFKEKRIKTIVRNDTLYLNFPNTYNMLPSRLNRPLYFYRKLIPAVLISLMLCSCYTARVETKAR